MKQEKRKRMAVVLDDFSDIDRIGYDEYSEGLVEMIRSVGAKGEKGSFTIGVFGQWGQGKTSMLRQIEKKLNEIETKDEKEILTVWFNPWQFTGEEHIIIPFFHTLVSYLEEFNKKKGKSVSGSFTNFLKELAHVPVALAYGMEGKIKIPLLLETKFKLKDVIDEARKKKEELEKKSEPEIKKLVNEYESMYYRLISRLQGASTDLNLKIVVFIDDLDRCLPEKAVELLEGLKVLLDLSGFVFVIAVAREVIEQGIRVRYKELYSSGGKGSTFLEQDYLDKIIQFPLTLPPPDIDRLKSMVDNYLKDLAGAKPYLETIQKSLGTNPRCLKRCINNLSYTFWVAKRKGEFRTELLIKMTLIAFLFPGFYRVIGKTPAHLIRVQDIINKKRDEKEKEKPGDEDIVKESTGTGKLSATGFPEIDDLKLLDQPNLESITEILAKQKREGVENDKGFENEDEVRRYVSLLSITGTPEGPKLVGTGDLWKTMESRMVQIPAGNVLLKDEKSGNEFTAEISPFFMDKFPVTQDLYEKVMEKEKNKSHFEGGDRPVETVSWFDAVKFCNRLSNKTGLKPVYIIDGEKVTPDWDAKGFRLPTEAEWEYACRAGTIGERYGEIDEIAWYDKNSNGSTQGVGKKEPNIWGLYDMLGNVWEWCWDWYEDYPKEDKKDWRGPGSGSPRVNRGGSWFVVAHGCACALRGAYLPADRGSDLGFRLARSF
ncbi:MAG: SUMF1/EgtB/PvdO family nonheme iron enzyme [Candidatus Aminicenantes bacterium]|nr:MAG: SUMF1/EgtB/PvdO family nonheme iron enzyme [Candidatus Aminicenantes bacterium]